MRTNSPYINHFISPDSIIPRPYTSQDWNRYSYARNNPLRYTDPSGHYVCTGHNEKWGKRTCYDIINAWLDSLYLNGGDEGKSLVEDFMAKDALDPITIEFLEDLGVWGQTDSISDTITITLNSGTADDNIGKGFDVASFGHELFHLLRQESDELGTAKSEKDAYDYEATLLKNMGVPLDPAWAVTVISNLGTSKEEMKKIAKALNVPVSNSLFNQDPITNWVGEAIEAVFQTVTGCYRSVYSMSCFPPGPYDVRYEPPSK